MQVLCLASEADVSMLYVFAVKLSFSTKGSIGFLSSVQLSLAFVFL